MKRTHKLPHQKQHAMASSSSAGEEHAAVGWANLPKEILMLITPLLYDSTLDIANTKASRIPTFQNRMLLPVARLVCYHWAYSLPHSISKIRKCYLKGAGTKDWGTRMLSGLEELEWVSPRALRCAPWNALASLSLTKARSTNIALRILFSCCPPRLAHLDISESNVTDAGLIGAWPPSLVSLSISFCDKITDAALPRVGHIASLVLDKCPALNGSGLHGLHSVTSLSICGVNIVNWEGLRHMSNLVSLKTSRVEGLMSFGTSLSFVSSLRNLVMEHLPFEFSTNVVMEELRDLPSLSDLFFNNCPGLLDESVTSLKCLTSLSILKCDNFKAHDMAPLTLLSKLSLVMCDGVEDAALLELGRMRCLETLHVYACAGVSHEGLQALRDARPALTLID